MTFEKRQVYIAEYICDYCFNKTEADIDIMPESPPCGWVALKDCHLCKECVKDICKRVNSSDNTTTVFNTILGLRNKVKILSGALETIEKNYDHEHSSKGSVGKNKCNGSPLCRCCIAKDALEQIRKF